MSLLLDTNLFLEEPISLCVEVKAGDGLAYFTLRDADTNEVIIGGTTDVYSSLVEFAHEVMTVAGKAF